jgi:hypothetical protein
MITQGLLLDSQVCLERNVARDTVKANFTDLGSSEYQVLLEVSTNKFLVHMTKDENGIQSFEIVAMKGFMEVTTKIINLLKRLITHLWEMVD